MHGPNGELQFVTIKALNEWDSKVCVTLLVFSMAYLHTVRVAEALPAEAIIESCWLFLCCSFLAVLSGVRSWILSGELCLQMSYEIMPANLQNGPCRLFWQGQTRSNLGTYSCCWSLKWKAVAWTAGVWFLAGVVISFFSFQASQDRLWYPPVIIRGFFHRDEVTEAWNCLLTPIQGWRWNCVMVIEAFLLMFLHFWSRLYWWNCCETSSVESCPRLRSVVHSYAESVSELRHVLLGECTKLDCICFHPHPLPYIADCWLLTALPVDAV